jgi:hypothetical protein
VSFLPEPLWGGGGSRCPGVTVPGPAKAVRGASRRRDLKCLVVHTDLELLRAVGSHASLRSCSDISDIVGCDAGPNVSGGKTFVQPVEQTGSWCRAGVGLVT